MCAKQHLCGQDDFCSYRCKLCRVHNCHDYSERYASVKCNKWKFTPYVCNTYQQGKLCWKDKYTYTAQYANVAVKRRRSESGKGIRLGGEESCRIDEELDCFYSSRGI